MCGKAYTVLQNTLPSLQMILVAGPRIKAQSLEVPEGVEVRQYVPRLYEHFSACDVAVIQCGATSTVELTALQRPFIYLPLEEHSEQVNIARNLSRRGIGIPMSFSKATPSLLAKKISDALKTEVAYPKIATDGAQRAVQLIVRLLERSGKSAAIA